MIKRWLLPAGFVIAACLAGISWYVLRTPAHKPVFLIVVDTLRDDRLSCYGYDGHETASIDSLAARGVLFENTISVASWTVPSMGAIMTSLYPSQIGLVEKPISPELRIPWQQRRQQVALTVPLYYKTLAEVMRDAGYHTAGFVNQPALNNHDGFVQGYTDWYYPSGTDSVLRRDPAEPLAPRGLTRKKTTVWEHVDRTDAAIVDTFIDWIKTAPRNNLFVWLHLLSPHKPYTPPAEFAHGPPGRPASDNPASDLYDGEIRYCDFLVGKVLRAIDEHIGLDRSVIVFTADHGEEFGEHGMEDHGHSLHGEVIRVPLIISSPGLPAGVRVDSRVRLTDIFPTVLSLCGEGGSAPAGLEGIDLTPFVIQEKRDLPVYSEGMLYGSTKRSYEEGDFKLIWDQQEKRFTLYRPAADPDELIDLSSRFQDETRQLKIKMQHFHKRLVDDYAQRSLARTDADSLAAIREREKVLKAMRSLGYVKD